MAVSALLARLICGSAVVLLGVVASVVRSNAVVPSLWLDGRALTEIPLGRALRIYGISLITVRNFQL